MQSLDDTDNKIVKALMKDAHVSSAELSEQLNISAPTIRRRIKSLIKNEAIRIQAVQINRTKTALTVAILLKMENSAIVKTADLLASQKDVGFIVLTAGYHNIICVGWFESIEAYSKLLNTVIYPIKGVLDSDMLICTEYKKYAFVKLKDNDGSIRSVEKTADDIDMKIIEAMEKDARQSCASLAKRLDISAPTVRRRINRLLDSNIIRIQAFPNLRGGQNTCGYDCSES